MKFLEATLIYPITILIIISLITLMMNFYLNLDTQISEHEKLRAELYKTDETTIIRVHDKLEEISE